MKGLFMKGYLMAMLACWMVVGQQLPIPTRPLGMSTGSADAPIQILEFFDLQCPDCMLAAPVVDKVLSHYGPSTVRYTAIVYPLWLHRQAWDLAKTAAIVQAVNPAQALDFCRAIFDKQATYYNAAWHNRTEAELYAQLATDAAPFGVSREVFDQLIDADATYMMADMQVHYGISRQVMGTPSFFINGVLNSSIDETTDFQTWVSFIDSLLNAH